MGGSEGLAPQRLSIFGTLKSENLASPESSSVKKKEQYKILSSKKEKGERKYRQSSIHKKKQSRC